MGKHWVMSDLHGDYEGYMNVLQKMNFSEEDVLYVVGDIVDRGRGGIKILQHMMMQPNIYPILGNHEYMGVKCLRFLLQEITEESIATLNEGIVRGLLEWQNVGGQATMDEFHKLSMEEKLDIVEYLEDFALYEEITVCGKTYIMLHAGFIHFDPGRPMSDYQMYELIFKCNNYNRVYFPDKYLVTGHLPTRAIHGNSRPDCIYRANNHIAIDCGSGYGGRIGAYCLETEEEVYSRELRKREEEEWEYNII